MYSINTDDVHRQKIIYRVVTGMNHALQVYGLNISYC
jgi:hypothetical protein